MPTKPKEILAVSAAIEQGGRFLLVRRGRAPAKGLFAFPGGRVEANEKAEQALARELFEETGLRLASAEPYREIVLQGDGPEQIYRLTVYCASVSAGPIIAGDDASEVGWFGPGEIAAMPLTESTRTIIDALRRKTSL